jgi:carboxymethylenebutenolidase
MDADMISRFEKALREWGGKFESETYDGAAHGWTVPGGPIYHHAQAERAYDKLTDFLDEALK